MCGRYYIADEDTAEDLKRIIDEVNRRHNGDPSIKTSGKIRPTDTIPVLANTPSLQPGAYAMRWGYTMPDGTPMFNARSETAASKVMFKDGMASDAASSQPPTTLSGKSEEKSASSMPSGQRASP